MAGLTRRLLLLTGDPEVSAGRLADALDAGTRGDLLWIADEAPGDIEAVPASRVAGRLGSESGLLVFNAHQGFHPDAFAAAIGTLRGGGDCVLLIPPLQAWPAQADPDQARFAAYPLDASAMRPYFLERLVRLWQADPAVETPAAVEEVRRAGPAAGVLQLNDEQLQAVDAVIRVARGHARRPLVLDADRGRGKSTVLGVAAARLLREGFARITVIAPHRRAVQTLFRHALGSDDDAPSVVGDHHLPGGELRFRLPQEFLDEPDHSGLLLVDEAAAIPLGLLERLLDTGTRLVFASTVHGYEGSGRGFVLRFLRLLERKMPQWRRLALQAPVRWSPGDPLEALLNRSLLLDAEPHEPAKDDAEHTANLSYRRIAAADLALDEPLLRAVFGLLVTAHYQTRPSDLRQLLDNPLISVWVAQSAGRILGVLLGSREGSFDAAMADEVLAGRRRPRGHLLPQSLAVHEGIAEILGRSVMRVQRIAVHPACHRRGIGSGLLQALAMQATRDGIELLGCAYGAEPGVLQFWLDAGFEPVRVGRRVDPASGAHSLFMLRGLDDDQQLVCDAHARRFRRQLPWALADGLSDLDPRVAARLLGGRDNSDLMLEQADRRLLGAIAAGQRQPEGVEYPVICALLRLFEGGGSVSDERAALLSHWLQRHTAEEVGRRFGLASAGSLTELLRECLSSNVETLLKEG